MRFVFLPNEIELIASIEFSNRAHKFDESNLLERSSSIDCVRLPNQSNNNPTDWVRLSSINFWFGLVRLVLL